MILLISLSPGPVLWLGKVLNNDINAKGNYPTSFTQKLPG